MLEDYLRENPDKTAADFLELKTLSDEMVLHRRLVRAGRSFSSVTASAPGLTGLPTAHPTYKDFYVTFLFGMQNVSLQPHSSMAAVTVGCYKCMGLHCHVKLFYVSPAFCWLSVSLDTKFISRFT